jgi:8-oxo-dGTP pyrophosphatase MutT (NUDIX family)
MDRTWDGKPISPDPPFGVAVVIYRRGDDGPEVLLLHRAHHGPDYAGDWAWTPPAGARLPGESIEACIQRELLEEVGLSIQVTRTEHGPPEWPYYRAEVDPSVAIVLGDDEHDRYEWVSLSEATRRCLPAVVAEAIRMVGDEIFGELARAPDAALRRR